MASLYADNVTKVRAGGSGDNVVADGFIKTVEKVWIDTYTCAAVIASTSSICIGKVPKGKKLVDVIVFLPVLSAAGTTSTVYLDTAATTTTASWGGALEVSGSGSYAGATATISSLHLGHTKAFSEMPEDVDLYIMITPATTITSGVIKSKISWT